MMECDAFEREQKQDCDVVCNLRVQDTVFVGMAVGGDPKVSNYAQVMSNLDNMYCWCYAEMV